MSRRLFLVTILGLLATGLKADSLTPTQSWVPRRFCDAVGTSIEGSLANGTKTDLATEKERLDKELCEARSGPSVPIVEVERKIEALKEAGKPVVREQKIEKLPGNKTKEVVVTELTEKLPSNATVKKTVERQVVKAADSKSTVNETVIEKETRTDTSPSNESVAITVTEHKVVKGEECKEVEEEKTEGKEAEKEIVENVPEKLPVNVTVKKTSVEHKVVTNTSKDGEPQKEIVSEKKTLINATKATEVPTMVMVNASVLDEKAGPKKVVVTKKKIEEFPSNETKEVVVKEEAEKLPSNDTIKTTVVERIITKDKGKDGDGAQQETIIEKEVEAQITNKTAEAKTAEAKAAEAKPAEIEAAGKSKKQEYKEKIENIKHQVEEVKEEIKEEEIKTEKLDGVPESCKE